MTIKSWIKAAAQQLKTSRIESARLDAELLLAEVMQKDRSWLITHDSDEIPGSRRKQADAFLLRRLQHEPLAYIRGFKEFYGRDFVVTPDVLIPRPESEAVIELAKRCGLHTGDTILDVGTGSGCLGVTLRLELPETEVTLLDISQPALDIAEKNARQLHTTVHTAKQDLFNFTAHTKLPGQPFSLIVANLPYVDEGWECSPETAFEPSVALFSGANGLWHSINLLSAAHYLLRKDGYLILETDPRQHKALKHYASKLGFELVATDGFATLFSRAQVDYSATQPGAPLRSVDHYHA